MDNNLNLHIYTGDRFLIPYIKDIQNIFTTTMQSLLSVLSIHNVDIDVYSGELKYAPEAGIIGHTESLHHISIAIMPLHPEFQTILSHHLAGTIVHELHHIARWRMLMHDKTFLQSLITEGLAGHFESEITGQPPSLCFTTVSTQEIESLLPHAQGEFAREDYNHDMWFTGSGTSGIPHWAGYGIGYYLVGKYLEKHPEETAASLFATRAEMIIT